MLIPERRNIMTTFENHTHAQMHAQKAAVGSARELGGERERQKESWEERGKYKKRVGRREGNLSLIHI